MNVKELIKILSEKLALLYGNFEIVEVSGFDYKTASSFIGEKLTGVSLTPDWINYLIDFTDGNPFYLDVLAKKINEIAAHREFSENEEMVVEALTVLLYNTNGTINQYFTNSIMKLLKTG